MLPDLRPLVPFLGPVFVVLVTALAWGGFGRGYPTQYGRANARARRRLRSLVRSWPAKQHDAVIRWQDHGSATRLDVREALHEAGWYVRDEDADGDGWPFHVTRDPARATSTDPPPTRGALLVGLLREAGRARGGVGRRRRPGSPASRGCRHPRHRPVRGVADGLRCSAT